MSPASGGRSDGRLLVAVDAGTGGARAVAIDLQGKVVAEVRRPYQTESPQPGWAEQNPQDWASCAIEALTALSRRLSRRQKVMAIGLTGQCPTVAPFGSSGRPVGRGLLYRDNRATEEAKQMRELLGEAVLHRRTGHVAEAFHIGPKLLWLRRHQPKTFQRAVRFLQPRDVVLKQLTGRQATDESHANATLFFDLRERRWAADLFAAFDLEPSIFPEAIRPWSIAGELSRGIGSSLPAGVPVVIGAADSQCAALGAGVTEPGPVSEMAGTSSCLNSAVVEPLSDLRITHYSHVVPERYCTELGVNTAGAAIDWAVRQLGYPNHEKLAADATRFRASWARAERDKPGDPRDVAPLFIPYLGDGERDDPSLRGGFIGLSQRHDHAALAFSILEGITLAVWRTLQILERAGAPLNALHVSGGGGSFPLMGQLKADLLNRPVLHLDHDATDLGAAMLAGVAVGLEAEARAAIAAGLRRARRFEPSPWGRELATQRAAWFEQVIDQPALRLGTARA